MQLNQSRPFDIVPPNHIPVWWLGLFGLCVFSLVAALLWCLSLNRGINPDEGFYSLAGWRVLAGEKPYADFFYPQMPYLPNLESWLLSWGGPSLSAGRLLSVVPGAIVAALLAVFAAHQCGRISVGMIVTAVYSLHSLVWNYLTVTKTYGLSNLALVLALLLLLCRRQTAFAMFLAGLAAVAAVGIRLPTAAAVLVMLIWLGFRQPRSLLPFIVGGAVGSLPLLLTIIQSPENFWFCNIEFHGLRREISSVGAIAAQKVAIVGKWLLLPQNFLVWVLAVSAVWKFPRRSELPALCALALAIAYLGATPTYLDYLLQILPFLLVLAVPLFDRWSEWPRVSAVMMVIYVVGLLVSQRPAAADSARARKLDLWSKTQVERVTSYLRNHSAADGQILSWWEGYPFLAGRKGFRGVGFWESNAAKKLPTEERERYHLRGVEEIRQLVADETPVLIVRRPGVWKTIIEIEEHYELASTFGEVEIWRPRASDG